MASLPVKDFQLCPFCGNMTYYKYKEIVGDVDVYGCPKCPFTVEIHKYKDVDAISMIVPLKGIWYAVDFWRPYGGFSVSEVTHEGSWVQNVVELPFEPTGWNPTNIVAKLETVLTFL